MAIPGRKLYQQIAERIAASIGEHGYPPGARLPGERDLAEEFSVSRPTIREAMIALEMRGLVEARHGAGIFVTRMPEPAKPAPELDVGAFELIEARTLFEGEAAALAATAISAAALERLDGLLDDMAANVPDSPGATEADRLFHLAIAEATGNTLVRSVVEMLWNVRNRSPLCIRMFDQARREAAHPRIDEHRQIVDALRLADATAARDAMHAHLRRVTDDLLAATELELLEKARRETEAHRSRIAGREVR